MDDGSACFHLLHLNVGIWHLSGSTDMDPGRNGPVDFFNMMQARTA